MSRNTRTLAGVILVGVIVAVIALAYLWFSGGSGAPSATLSAPTLAIANAQPTDAAANSGSSAEATLEEAMTPGAMTDAVENGLVLFSISTEGSKVSFSLGEILNGSPNKVVGTTDQVAGQIAVDFATPAHSLIGEIRIDARTLATDSPMRDRMIRGQILQSAQDQYEFISFKPKTISGLPASITMGTAFSFEVTGDLTIRSITQAVTFAVTVTPYSTDQIAGIATATVQRDDFGLTIPNVPSVTQADEDVKLEIDFVATADA